MSFCSCDSPALTVSFPKNCPCRTLPSSSQTHIATVLSEQAGIQPLLWVSNCIIIYDLICQRGHKAAFAVSRATAELTNRVDFILLCTSKIPFWHRTEGFELKWKAFPKPLPFIKESRRHLWGVVMGYRSQEKEAPDSTDAYQVVQERSLGTQKDVLVNATELIMQLGMNTNWTAIVGAPFLVTWNLSPLGHWFKSSWGLWWKKITST